MKGCGNLKNKWRTTIVFILLSAALIFFALMYLSANLLLSNYARVYQDPLVTEATVTRVYCEVDSDGEATYTAYIAYTAAGNDYTDVSYKISFNVHELPEEGSTFPLKLNPEDPSQLLSELADPVPACLFAGLAILTLCVLLRQIHRRKLTKNEMGVIDLETAIQDMRALIMGRFIRPFCCLNAVNLCYLCYRFPMVFSQNYLVVAAVLGCVWLVCLRNAIRQNSCIVNEEFQLIKGMHIYKDVHVDPKTGASSNVIHYRLGKTKWAKIVSSAVYQHVRTGFSINSVYLNIDRKKPFLQYDNNGNACGN